MISISPDSNPRELLQVDQARNPHPPLLTILRKTLSYSIVSGASLGVALFVSPPFPSYSDLSVLFALLCFTLYFSLCYSVSHPVHFPDPQFINSERQYLTAIVVVSLFVLFLGVANLVPRDGSLSVSLLWTIGVYGIVCCGYGLYLVYQSNQRSQLVRHTLLWPPITAVAINVYIGLQYSTLTTSAEPLIIIVIYAAFLFLSEAARLKSGSLLLASLFSAAALTAAAFARLGERVWELNFHDWWFDFLFALTMSAYLAVFESWPRAAWMTVVGRSDLGEATILPENAPHTQAAQYYSAALVALLVAMCLMPAFYLIGDVGLVFLIGFLAHSISSLVFWLRAASRVKHLAGWNWAWIRNLSAVLFLACLAADATWKRASDASSSNDEGYLLTITVTLCGVVVFNSIRGNALWNKLILTKWATYRNLLTERVNAVRLLGVASAIGVVVVLAGRAFAVLDGTQLAGRSLIVRRVYWFYLVFAVAADLVFNRWSSGSSPTAAVLLALAMTTRLATGILVLGVIAIPGIAYGVSPVLATIAGLPLSLAAMGGCALNDCADVERDRINHPKRALPSGMLSYGVVLGVALTMLISSLVFTLLTFQTTMELAINLLGLSGVCFYNVIVRNVPVLKWVMAAVLSSLPAALAIHKFSLGMDRAWVLVAVLMFVAGREIMMDTLDMAGDQRGSGNGTTLPFTIGQKNAARVGWFLQVLGVSCLVPICLLEDRWSLWIAAAFSSTVILAIWTVATWRGALGRWMVYASWLPLAACVVYLLP